MNALEDRLARIRAHFASLGDAGAMFTTEADARAQAATAALTAIAANLQTIQATLEGLASISRDGRALLALLQASGDALCSAGAAYTQAMGETAGVLPDFAAILSEDASLKDATTAYPNLLQRAEEVCASLARAWAVVPPGATRSKETLTPTGVPDAE